MNLIFQCFVSPCCSPKYVAIANGLKRQKVEIIMVAQRRSPLLKRTSTAGDSMPNAHYDTMVKRLVEIRERILNDHGCNNSVRSLKKEWCIAILYLIIVPAARRDNVTDGSGCR